MSRILFIDLVRMISHAHSALLWVKIKLYFESHASDHLVAYKAMTSDPQYGCVITVQILNSNTYVDKDRHDSFGLFLKNLDSIQ